MTAPAGAAVGRGSHGLESSGILPTDMFDFSRMQEQLECQDKVVPRWFGHSLSLPPDSGIGLGTTVRMERRGEGRRRQGTLRPTSPLRLSENGGRGVG